MDNERTDSPPNFSESLQLKSADFSDSVKQKKIELDVNRAFNVLQ